MKQLLVEAPVLVHPRFGPREEFLLETDASGVGLGAVLSQKQPDERFHPIAYASRSLQPHEKNYTISELETLGLVWAVKYFRPYILGHHCTVLTDHAACVSLLNCARPSTKLARWAMIIQELDLEIKHRSGRSNASADALSRNPAPEATVAAITQMDPEVVESQDLADASDVLELSDVSQGSLSNLSSLQESDPLNRDMYKYLSEKELPAEDKTARRIVMESRHFELIDGVLYHETAHFPGRWCIAVPASLQKSLLQDAHGGVFAGHLAEKRVYDRLRRDYWWPGMRKEFTVVHASPVQLVKVQAVLVTHLCNRLKLVVPSIVLVWMCCSCL